MLITIISVLIASCVRLRYIWIFDNPADPTWDNMGVMIWTTIEVDVAICCSNLPAISALFSHYRKKTSSNSSENTSLSTSVQSTKGGVRNCKQAFIARFQSVLGTWPFSARRWGIPFGSREHSHEKEGNDVQDAENGLPSDFRSYRVPWEGNHLNSTTCTATSSAQHAESTEGE